MAVDSHPHSRREDAEVVMTRSRSQCLRAGAPGAIARSRFHRSLSVAMLQLVVATGLTAQLPTAPPGWSRHTSFQEATQPQLVRSTVQLNAKEHLVAVRQRLFRTGSQLLPASQPLLDLGPGEDIAFVVATAGGLFAAGSLHSGRVLLVDPDWGQVGTFAGVANAFDAVAIGADLLVVANPLWPQAGANSGVWLLGPARVPREILALVGPSGPLELLPNGDLVVGELGPIVPPPPGAARLLLLPAGQVAAAVAGATLSMADVTAIGTGYAGLYDLAADSQGHLHVSDVASSVVVHTAPGGLVPIGTTLDVGGGRFALTLQFLPHGAAPFRGYQPAEAAPALAIGTSDFATSYEWIHLRAQRPLATAPTGPTVAVGPFAVDVGGAPPLGLALAFASQPGPGSEVVVATLDGTPLWCGLSLSTTFFVAGTTVAANGIANLMLHNPGGTPGAIDLQILALDPTGTGDLGSSAVLRLDLLP